MVPESGDRLDDRRRFRGDCANIPSETAVLQVMVSYSGKAEDGKRLQTDVRSMGIARVFLGWADL